MSYLTKKQISLALVVVALSAVMISGNIFSSTSNNSAYAKKGTNQEIKQSSKIHQKMFCGTAGANSGISNSCSNTATSTQDNSGSNNAGSNGNSNGGTNQEIKQSSHQKQTIFCGTAGANSPIENSCHNLAVNIQHNKGSNTAG
jgi:hypothetical protein